MTMVSPLATASLSNHALANQQPSFPRPGRPERHVNGPYVSG